MRLGLDVRAAIWYRASGIGTYTYQLWHNLSRIAGEKHQFIPLGEKLEELNSCQPAIRLKKINFWQALQDDAGHTLRKMDIYHNPQNGFGLPALWAKTPLVVTIHDLIPYILPQTCSRVYLRLFLEMVPRIVEKARMIIAVSMQTKDDIMRILRVREDKIRIIYEAADPVYRPLPMDESGRQVLDKYGLKSGRYFLHVGGFSRRKNALAVIKSLSRLNSRIPGYQLAVVGRPDGGCFDECVKLIGYYNLKGKVILTGLVPVEEMPYLYNGARALVYPSLYEGFGLPLVEAMACGIPCIAGNVSSMPEIVSKSAILVNPYRPAEIEEAMRMLATDETLVRKLSAEGLLCNRRFDWEAAAKETIDVYEEIC